MSKFTDGMALSFAWFADHADPKVGSHASFSYVNTQISHSVKLTGRVASEVPEKARLQRFDEQYLLPIANKLKIEATKTAILITLRDAWIAYFLDSEISKISVDGIRLLLTNEIATDYVVLTSDKWSEHPWMQEQINQPQVEEYSASSVLSDDPQYIKDYQALREQQLNDIHFCIKEFRSQKGRYTSILDVDADSAEHDIKNAKKRIGELHAEHRTGVEQQEKIIRAAMIPIRKFKNYEKALKNGVSDLPKNSEEQQQRRDIATKFVAKWVGSLMAVLSISSCGELAKSLGGQKMTWWRWQNEKQLPPSSYLESLLDDEIKYGDNKGTKLRDIHTTPLLIDLIGLVSFV